MICILIFTGISISCFWIIQNLPKCKFVLVPIIILSFLVSTFLHNLLHDSELSQLQSNLSQTPHPIDSKLVGSMAEIGNFIGSYDNCDYLVGEIRSTFLSEQDILSFYSSKKTLKDLPIGIGFVRENVIEDGHGFEFPSTSLRRLSEWGVDMLAGSEELFYAVYVLKLDDTFWPWDIRCYY